MQGRWRRGGELTSRPLTSCRSPGPSWDRAQEAEEARGLRDGMSDRREAPAPVAKANPMARLLVLACSATKRPDPHSIPALARYDGPLWRTLRAADPEGRRARVAFLSALYVFRDAATPIADYDARLTQDLAERMIAGGVTTRWPRPPSPHRPDTYGIHAGAEIASLTVRVRRKPYCSLSSRQPAVIEAAGQTVWSAMRLPSLSRISATAQSSLTMVLGKRT